ncbi:YhdP family protein [Frigidibacter sp. ROC022]|uniref:YhdP family protein n=1 Tax=Frigidibacter sp. ROC022 TaxID=2971796 RepID=UPI00215B08EB|nr:AsmA-like C-terminal region-containing protein [Frigidibacter sp. ROC022]MCR8723558.1 hypothetical protein [Frigidibacter sp. ROC022]
MEEEPKDTGGEARARPAEGASGGDSAEPLLLGAESRVDDSGAGDPGPDRLPVFVSCQAAAKSDEASVPVFVSTQVARTAEAGGCAGTDGQEPAADTEPPETEAPATPHPDAAAEASGSGDPPSEVEAATPNLLAKHPEPGAAPMVLSPAMRVAGRPASAAPVQADPALRLAESPEPRRGRRRNAPVPDPDAPAIRPQRSRAHRIARHTVRHGWRFVVLWSIAAFAFAVAFALLAALALIDRPVTLPGWVAHRVETQINRGLPAGHISLDRIEIELERGEVPQVRLKNVGIFDASGAEVARLNEVGAGFDLPGLVRGDLIPDALRLSGAQITVRRKRDGSLDLSFGDVAAAGSSGSAARMLETIDEIFAAGPLSEIETIAASELTITLEDARTSRLWQVTDGRLLFSQTARQIEISVAFDVFNGTEDLASTSFTFHSDKGTPAAEIGAAFSNAASGDIALQSPVLAFLGVLDAPISGALRLSVGADAELTDFAGTLEIGEGTLTPGEGAKPIRIDRGKAYFTFDPARRRIDFSDLSIASDALEVQLSGQTYLQDLGEDGWPNAYVGQFRLLDLVARADDYLLAPLHFHDGLAELKLVLNPFQLRVGKLRLRDGDSTIRLAGSVTATAAGPDLALDATIDRISTARLLELWPPELIPKTRAWLGKNLLAGNFTDARGAWRRAPGQADRTMLGATFNAASMRFMKTMPPITSGSGYLSIDGDRMVVRADTGLVQAPEGGVLDIAGTVFVVPDIRVKPAQGEISLAARGPIPAVLSLLDQNPFRVMQKAGRPVALAEGQADLTADISLPLIAVIGKDDVTYSASGSLTDVRSDKIVQGRMITSDKLSVAADGQTLTIDGKARFGALPVDVTWRQGIAPGDPGTGRLDGQVELSQTFMEEFGIDLPPGAVRGKGTAKVEIETGSGAPTFRLTSDLRGLALKIESIVWTKAAAAKGRLELSGSLGSPPKIDRIVLEGGGLTASGSIALKADGQLDEARFDRVRLGGWLDAPVTLQGRGRGVQPGVLVRGGSLDFRRAAFGEGAGGSAGGPVSVRLDRLSVADGITLTGFNGEFSTRGGFNGKFTARLNGGGVLNGTVAPQNGGTALRVISDNAGDVLKDANLAKRVRGGAMELILIPTGRTGIYDGSLTAKKVRIRGTPALAELLNAVSIVGLMQQLNGDGLVFDNVEARFLLTPNAINFTRASAIGASLGISVEGSYTLGSGALDLRGVFSPLYLLNGIGQIFGKKGEGLFGFNYRVQGTSENPKVSVNPLSIFTPGMFREIFNTPPPEIK